MNIHMLCYLCCGIITIASIVCRSEPVPISGDQVTLDSKTSRALRKNKNYLITYQAFGVGPLKNYGNGLAFGKFLSSDLILFIEGVNGGMNLFLDDGRGKVWSIGGHAKYFVGNSFYWRGGIDSVSTSYRCSNRATWFSFCGDDFDAQSAVISISIGNQWQWENFTLGTDWIGFGTSFPLSSAATGAEGGAVPDHYGKVGSAGSLLRFYLGFAF